MDQVDVRTIVDNRHSRSLRALGKASSFVRIGKIRGSDHPLAQTSKLSPSYILKRIPRGIYLWERDRSRRGIAVAEPSTSESFCFVFSMASAPAPLTESEKEHFRQRGFVHLKTCFTREQAESITKDVWMRLGMDPADKSTWTASKTNMPNHNTFSAAKFAPRAWAAICELCGGGDRIAPKSSEWRDGFIVNLGSPEKEGQKVNPQDLDNWHVDGDFFVHYLDSPEQALLVIPLFTDIGPGGGGTMICPEAIPKVAQHLYDHPEGVSPRMRPRGHDDFKREKDLRFFCDIARSCSDFVEVTGKCGDVFLLHPLMLHSATTNPLRQVRIITNPPVSLKEPFEFNKPIGSYSLVEQTTLRALGKASLGDWAITAPRETIVPERMKAANKMKEEELRRLAGTDGDVSTVA